MSFMSYPNLIVPLSLFTFSSNWVDVSSRQFVRLYGCKNCSRGAPVEEFSAAVGVFDGPWNHTDVAIQVNGRWTIGVRGCGLDLVKVMDGVQGTCTVLNSQPCGIHGRIRVVYHTLVYDKGRGSGNTTSVLLATILALSIVMDSMFL